jgi:hypothetical protein
MAAPERNRPFDFLHRTIHLIERAGATLFLLVAIYCGLIEAVAFTASTAAHALAFARERTHHAYHAISELAAEVKKWHR